jgi:hypothetical protein
MGARSLVLFAVLLLLGGAAAVLLAAEEQAHRRQQARSEEFQHLVGGLGFGPALDLTGGALGFDPRLGGTDEQDLGPVPGGSCFIPRRASSLFAYPGPARDVPRLWEEGVDAPPP